MQSVNPKDYGCCVIEHDELQEPLDIDELLNLCDDDEVTAGQLLVSALEEMDDLGTNIVTFSAFELAIYKNTVEWDKILNEYRDRRYCWD